MLSRFCFSLSFEHPEKDAPLNRDYFAFKLPASPDLTRLVLRSGSNVLAELTVGATPTVRIDAPTPGERFE